jgi:hypothetical protein
LTRSPLQMFLATTKGATQVFVSAPLSEFPKGEFHGHQTIGTILCVPASVLMIFTESVLGHNYRALFS